MAGQPIKGVIVKGGINPGGNKMTVVSNSDGVIELNNLEAGNYQFTITAPEEPAGKSISSKGVRRTAPEPANAQATSGGGRTYTAGRKNEPNALVAGSPIGGIVVKGGKNPGGNLIVITTNNNGVFELNVPEAGDYKFTITAPEQPAGKSISEKGLKRN